ncbi:expressed unknown protein [Seminavis robusta]|uniref:Uncharacterized protein n=1 Tax=Seminavis robusta TaxID=568900 RepID=A0A9N8HQY0_9STRA|nr:expressed unknown protein [Seminavis robusta]|eukprot:Sro1251_g256170.2  (1735) ;mRNA; r:13530-19056
MQEHEQGTNPLRELLDSEPTALDGFLSYEYGLCSPRPLDQLEGIYALWEEWAEHLPSLYQTGAYRDYFDGQPVLTTENLNDADLLRANQILGLAAHATVHFSKMANPGDQRHKRQNLQQKKLEGESPGAWVSARPAKTQPHGMQGTPSKCPFAPPAVHKSDTHRQQCSDPTDNVKGKNGCIIPAAIFQPWKEVNLRLGRPKPTFTYYDYFTLNVVHKNDAPRTTCWEPDGDRAPQRTYSKVSCDVRVFGDYTENIFVVVNHDMEYQTTPLIGLCCDAVDYVLARNDEGLASVLLQMGEVVKKVTYAFLQAIPNANSERFVDPVGWSKSIGMLIPPILEGEFSMSGLQSSFVHLMDVLLGRYCYNGEIGGLAMNERPWLPFLHQEFFRRLGICSVRKYVCQSQSRALRSSFDRLVRLFASEQGFLGVHRIKTMGFLELGVKTGRTESSGQTAQTTTDVGWQARVWRKVNEDLYQGIEERMNLQTNVSSNGFTEAFVQNIEEIGVVPGSESYRVTFNIAGAGMTYRAGDRLEIMPANGPEIIGRMLKAMRVSSMDLADSNLLVTVDTDEWKEAVAKSYEKITAQSFPIAALLRIMHLRPLTKTVFDSVCAAAGMSGHSLVERELRQGKIHDVPELIELLRDMQPEGALSSEAIHELPSKLCSILPPLRPRLYSIANSPPPMTSPSIVSIVISRLWFEADSLASGRGSLVFDGWSMNPSVQLQLDDMDDDSETLDISETSDHMDSSFVGMRSRRSGRASMVVCDTKGKNDMDGSFVRSNHLRSSTVQDNGRGKRGSTVRHMGVCTSFLLNHSLYRYVPIKAIEDESFHLPPGDDKNPLVLVALGSGAAPMFAFLEELLDRGKNDCPGQIYFYWGLRYSRNLFGVPLLERAMEELGVQVFISFSGEMKAANTDEGRIRIVTGRKERITTAMKRGTSAIMLARLTVLKGNLFLCGHPMLDTSMRSVLETVVCTTLGYSPKQSSAKYELMMAEQRIRTDCFYSGSVHDPSLPAISYAEVAKHNSMDDLWWVYKDHVYDVTSYLRLHPGGTKILFDKGGRDATEDFVVAHGPHNLRVESAMIPYRIGNLHTPQIEAYADKKAYGNVVKFLHKICEIRNVFFLDANIFPGQQEASGIAHSVSMRFKTHEKFITSTLPMLERAAIELCSSLEKEIPCSRLIRMRRTIPTRLTKLATKQLKPLLTKGSSSGNLCYVATELCRIEMDFMDQFHKMVVDFVSSIENQLEMDCHDERPDAQFAHLQAVCDHTARLVASRLAAASAVPPEEKAEVENVKSALMGKGMVWKDLVPYLDASSLCRLDLNLDDYVLRADDSQSCVYFVQSGIVGIEGGGELGAGAVFGALSEALAATSNKYSLGNGLMMNSVKVISETCRVLVLPATEVAVLKRRKEEDPAHSSGTSSEFWQRLKLRIRMIGVMGTMLRTTVIRQSSISSFLSEDACHKLARNCKEIAVDAGCTLRDIGDKADVCWILIEGSVDIVEEDKVLFTYNRYGQLFGEKASTSLAEEQLMKKANLVAAERTRLLLISEDAMTVWCGPLQHQRMALGWLREQLSSHEFFSSRIPEASMYALEREFRQVKVRSGETLFERGEAGDSCYVVVSGLLRLSSPSIRDTDVNVRDFAGVDQLAERTSRAPLRSANCLCVKEAVCWTLNRNTLEKVLGQGLKKYGLVSDEADWETATEASESAESDLSGPHNLSRPQSINSLVDDRPVSLWGKAPQKAEVSV